MQASATRNNTIDVFKLIASFFIIMLHVSYGTASETLVGIYRLTARFGVPFFFMAGGYFYQRSLERSAIIALKKNLGKIFGIIIISNLVYIPYTYISIHHLYLLQDITVGNCFNLWYLYSLILGITAMYLLFKWKANFIILSFIILCILIAVLLTDSHSYILGDPHPLLFRYYVRPLISIPCMLIGGLFYKCDGFKKYAGKTTGITLLVTGLIAQIAEAELIHVFAHRSIVIHQFLIGTFIYSMGVFILALSLNIKNNWLGRTGEKYSLFIYLYHPVLIIILNLLNYTSAINGNLILLLPVPIFFITLFTGVLLDKYVHFVFLLLNGSIKEAFEKKPYLWSEKAFKYGEQSI